MISRTVSLSPQFVLSCVKDLIENPSLLMRIDRYRIGLTQQRLQEALAETSGQLQAHSKTDTSDMIENTIRHNVENLDPTIAAWRPLGLMGPLLAMDQVMSNMSDIKILIIGPRTEQEILWYISMGLNPDNITGLDLISYSEFVKVGDMHEMPFPDDQFDIVIFSWVLGYSVNQKKAVSEAVRCVKLNGLVGIGEQWDPTPTSVTTEWMKETKGYALEGVETKSTNDLLKLFNDFEIKPRFINEPLESQKNRVGHISVIVEVQHK